MGRKTQLHFVPIFFNYFFNFFFQSLFLRPEDKKLLLFKFSVSYATLEFEMPKIFEKKKIYFRTEM
jgi:hypothetical protein